MEEQYITTILWRHRVLVAACMLAAMSAAATATLLQDKVYEGRATLRAGAVGDRNGGASPDSDQALARSYAEVLVSSSFLERIRPDVEGGTLTVRELQDRLEADAIADTAVVRIKARASSPRAARALAATVASRFLKALQDDANSRVQRQQAQIDALVQRLTARIESAGRRRSRIAQLEASRRALIEQGARLVADGVAEAGSARRVGPASASADPVRPRPLLNAIAGILFGLLLSAVLAWWRERRAPALRSAEDAASMVGAPVLAVVPLRRRPVVSDPALTEAYDMLRATLTFRSRDRGLRVITVIAENPAVGKTSTVEGLAHVAVRSGSSVVVVDADLRMGALSERLGHSRQDGFVDVIRGTRSLDEVLVELAPAAALLPANAPVLNPPSLLYSSRAIDVIRELRDRFDLVLIDAPPIGHLADGLILSSLSDGVVMVARSGVTSRLDLLSGVAKVRQTGTPIVGLVFFTAVDVDATYHYPASAGRTRRPDDAALSR